MSRFRLNARRERHAINQSVQRETQCDPQPAQLMSMVAVRLWHRLSGQWLFMVPPVITMGVIIMVVVGVALIMSVVVIPVAGAGIFLRC